MKGIKTLVYFDIEAFEKTEQVRDNSNKLSEYKSMLKAEKEVDVGNTNYRLIDKKNPNIVKVHIASVEDPTIDIMQDVGSLTPGLINIPVDGARVSLVDSVASILSDIYPDIAERAAEMYPALWLSDHIIRVHVKQGWDGTLGKSHRDKHRDRDECDHWLAGCLCVLQLDVEYGDGTRSVLWVEENPNSILTSPPLGLYKGEEANRPTLSYIMYAVESEIEMLSNNYVELESSVSFPVHAVEHHVRSQSCNNPVSDLESSNQQFEDIMDIDDNENSHELKFDDVVKDEFLQKYRQVFDGISKNDETKTLTVNQRFSIRVTSPKDEKFDRNIRGRAGAGSSKPCVHCNRTLEECMCSDNFGTLSIQLTNRLEREAIDFSLDNPMEMTRKQLEEFSFGMKRQSLTTSEPREDVSDYLHMHINVSGSFLFKIASRIYCFGFDDEPSFQMENTAAVKDKIEQAEVKYSNQLKKVITSLPSLTQMPGNFGREFIKKENRKAVLDPLPVCDEKSSFSDIHDLWESMASQQDTA